MSESTPQDSEVEEHKLIRDFFTGELYELARDAIIAFEATALEGAETHWIELRDATEHVRQAMLKQDPLEKRDLISQANDHLRRAAAEATQDMAEATLDRVISSLDNYLFKRLIFPELPSRKEVNQTRVKIADLIRQGRLHKADDSFAQLQVTMSLFKEAHLEAQNLLDKIQPYDPVEAKVIGIIRFTVPLATILGLLIAVITLILT